MSGKHPACEKLPLKYYRDKSFVFMFDCIKLKQHHCELIFCCCAFSSSLFQGFRTKDGHIVVAAGNDKQFVRVCQVKCT